MRLTFELFGRELTLSYTRPEAEEEAPPQLYNILDGTVEVAPGAELYDAEAFGLRPPQ